MSRHGSPCIVFAEEDALFRLMEAAVLREPTPQAEKALRYFYGADFSTPLATLVGTADRVGLPPSARPVVCPDELTLDQALPSADLLVVESAPITPSRIQAGSSQLKLIQKFGRECYNIDLAAASEHGVQVANFTRLATLSVAENVMALALALARNLLRAHTSVVSRRDPTVEPTFEVGTPRTAFNWTSIRGVRLLASHTLGLIGLGENGGEVAKRANSFGMRVVYYDSRHVSPETEALFGGVESQPLEQVLVQSDFLSLHVPYGPATERMVNSEFLNQMKPGAYLINTSRGGIVDEQALYVALKSGRLGGAALDVYRYEPVPPNCPLLDLDNVLWTPHMSAGEPDFMLKEVEQILSNLSRVWHGEAPSGLVPWHRAK